MKEGAVRPFDGPEFDTPPGSAPERTLTYVVCATPRTGSGLLCRAIAGTGVAGIPAEYFAAGRRAQLTRRWGCGSELPAYTHALQARRSDGAGAFATKLHWFQLEDLRGEALGRRRAELPFDAPASFVEDLVGAVPTYVRIVRRDVNRQAISLWIAEQSGIWNKGRPPLPGRSGRASYRFAGIERCRTRIALGELHWDRFFRFNGIAPIDVVYEELATNYEATVTRVLDRLVPGHDAVVPPPMSGRQADAGSERMLERFLDDLEHRHPVALRDRLVPRARALMRWR